MISEIDDALRSLVRAEVLAGGNDVAISFDMPDGEWAAQQNAPCVNLYLYDVSENLARREMAYEPVRDESGKVIERRPPPRRFDLAYLVSAWTQRVEDEHRLMDEILVCLLSHETLPPEHLADELADDPLPVRLSAGRPRPETRRATDVWNAVKGSLKPSIDLLVTTPFTTRRTGFAGPPVLETPRFEVVGTDGDAEQLQGRGSGAVPTATEREPVSEEVLHAGRESDEDDRGGRQFVVRGLPRR